MAISARKEIEVWWLQLVGGIIELALGFWAAGYWGRSEILLVAWAAAFTLIRGVKMSCSRSACASFSTSPGPEARRA
jgi:uncharacterized membrane protein HdeD (DUF308 family)